MDERLQEIIEIEARGYRATALRRLGLYLRENPESAAAWYYMGRFHASPAKQYQAIERALRLRPDYPEARTFKAVLLEEHPQLERKLFTRPVKIGLGLALGLFALALMVALGLPTLLNQEPEIVVIAPAEETPRATVPPLLLPSSTATEGFTPPPTNTATGTPLVAFTPGASPTQALNPSQAPAGFVSATPEPSTTPQPTPTQPAATNADAQTIIIAPIEGDVDNLATQLSAAMVNTFTAGAFFFDLASEPLSNDVQIATLAETEDATVVISGVLDGDALTLRLYAREPLFPYSFDDRLINLNRIPSPWTLELSIMRDDLGNPASFNSLFGAVAYVGYLHQDVIDNLRPLYSQPRGALDANQSLQAFMLAYSYQALGQQDEALKIYDMLTTYTREQNPYAAANRAYAIAQTGDYESAIILYLGLVAEHPDAAFIQTNIGEIYAQLGADNNAAMLAFDEAIRLNTNTPRPYLGRGKLLKEQQQYNRALEDFSTALSINPGYTPAYYERALLRSQLNLLDDALQDIDLAITFSPNNGAYYGLRGRILTTQEQYESASLALERALALGEDTPEVHSELAAVYYAVGNLDGAIRESNAALALAQDYAPAWYQRGVAYLAQNELGSALNDFNQGLALDETNVLLWVGRCKVHARLGDDGAAALDCDTALTLEPLNGAALEQRGLIRARADDRAGALADFQEAVRYTPNAYEAHYYLGLYALQDRRYEDALVALDRALELAPFLGKAYAARGVAYRITGAWELAIPDLEKALDLVPEDIYSYYELGLANRYLADRAFESSNRARAQEHYNAAAAAFRAFLDASQPTAPFVAEATEALRYVTAALGVIGEN